MIRLNKIMLFTWSLLLCSPVGRAQQPEADHLVDHRPLMNAVWETFDELMYKVTQENGETIYTPYFPDRLARLNGKIVTIKGYMIPIDRGRRHNTFLLSVPPLYQCMFCGQNGIPPMAEITLANGEKLPFAEDPIVIRGTVFLNGDDETHAEIQLKEANRL